MSTSTESFGASLFYSGAPEEDLGPLMTVTLPVEIVRGIRDLMRATPLNAAPVPIDPALMVDELNYQLQQRERPAV